MKSLSDKIAALEARKATLERKLGIPDPMAQSFPLGAGCGNAGGRKKHYAAMERSINDAVALKKVTEDLSWLLARQKAVDAGECYENGQRCADSPSRKLQAKAEMMYAEFLREKLVLPCLVELACNGRSIMLLRINKKTVTLEGNWDGDTWDHMDVRPLKADGTNHTDAEFMAMWREWRKSKAVAA